MCDSVEKSVEKSAKKSDGFRINFNQDYTYEFFIFVNIKIFFYS